MSYSLKFGTSGLRGLAAELAGTEARRFAAAFESYVRGLGTFEAMLVGRDLRASSPGIAADVIAGLDGPAIDCGALPTPALALEALRTRQPAIMVTGSHIPADRNGLKFYRADGEIDKSDETGIAQLVGDAPVHAAEPRVDAEVLERYAARNRRVLTRGALDGWRIGVWQHSSVARDLLPALLEFYGAEAVPLGRSDSFVSVDTEAVSTDTATELSGWVRAHGLDAVVSTDGDGDRPLLVDETGALIRGDVIGALTARYVGADTVVTPVTSNSAIEASGWFGKVVRTMVGSPYVIAGMKRAGRVVVGFEANGGVLLGTDIELNGAVLSALPTRDAVLPILSVLGAARRTGKTLSEIAATLPPRFARSDRLENVPADASSKFLRHLDEQAAHFFEPQGPISGVSKIDGTRLTLASGDVVHYRPSGNAPELRCYTEAATPERAEELLEWGLKAARAAIG